MRRVQRAAGMALAPGLPIRFLIKVQRHLFRFRPGPDMIAAANSHSRARRNVFRQRQVSYGDRQDPRPLMPVPARFLMLHSLAMVPFCRAPVSRREGGLAAYFLLFLSEPRS